MRKSAAQQPSLIGNVALAFARALVAGEYTAAQALLASSVHGELKPSDLKAQYEQMTGYWAAPADDITLICVRGPTEWDGKDDVGWAVVAIYSHPPNDSVAQEAVSVRVTNEAGQLRISDIVWGRP